MKRILLIPTLLFAFTVFGQIPTYLPINGLAAYYPFNGNANDLSVSANHGTVSGATLTTDRFGYPNQAYYFNGNGAYIGVPHSTVHIMQQATWNIWFKLIQPNNNNLNGRYLWGKRDNASNMVVMNVYFDNPNMQIGWGPGQHLSLSSNQLITDTNWHMLTMTYDQTISTNNMKIYQDGQLYNTGTFSNFTFQNGELRFGLEDNNSYWQHFLGCLDDATIHNRILSACEIQRLFLANKYIFISQQPTGDTIPQGLTTQFVVNTNTTGLSYHWQVNTGSGYNNLTNTNPYSGVNTNTLTITNPPGSFNQHQFRCVVSDGTCTDTSDAATLTVCSPLISSQPQPQSITENTSATFTIAGSGNNFQWQENAGSGFNDLTNTGIYTGVATNTLTITNAPFSINNYQYRCILSTGSCSDTSAIATLGITTKINDAHTSESLTIFPNPASKEVTISASFIITDIEVYDLAGRRLLLSKNNTSKSYLLDTERFQKGCYLIKINENTVYRFSKL